MSPLFQKWNGEGVFFHRPLPAAGLAQSQVTQRVTTVDKIALGEHISRFLRLSCVSIFQPLFCTHSFVYRRSYMNVATSTFGK